MYYLPALSGDQGDVTLRLRVSNGTVGTYLIERVD